MKKYNWQNIKKIASKFTGQTTPNIDGGKILPILAFRPEFAAPISSSLDHHSQFPQIKDGLYFYVCTLIEKDNQYEACSYVYPYDDLSKSIMSECRRFKKSDKNKILKYLLIPAACFKKSKHTRVISFKNTPMTEREFEDIIELWKTQPQQT